MPYIPIVKTKGFTAAYGKIGISVWTGQMTEDDIFYIISSIVVIIITIIVILKHNNRI